MEAAILAGMGVAKVPVYRQPRIVLLTTGDEVVEPGIPFARRKNLQQQYDNAVCQTA